MADILSQDELDALLTEMQIEDNLDEPAEPPQAPAAAAEIPATPVVERRPDDAVVAGPATQNVALILNLPVNLSVELGRTRMTVGDLLQLGQGSVIELQRMANDLIDLSINTHVMAQGEAVVVNENFGFRVVEVDSVRERIRKL
jgi:flagellar motor switch protein FliN